MDAFNVIAGVASILGLVAAMLTFVQAKRASRAAAEARNAVMVRTLADELELACVRAEQLVDFLIHGRLSEAALRVSELASSLSEMPRRRSILLDETDANTLLTSREQLQSIADVIQDAAADSIDASKRARMTSIARRVVTSLREILGAVKSKLESGA